MEVADFNQKEKGQQLVHHACSGPLQEDSKPWFT